MPEYKLTVNRKNRPKDDPIDVPPFGMIPNGGSKTVEMHPDQAKTFEGANWLKLEKTSSRGTAADEAWEDEIRQREAGILPAPEEIQPAEETQSEEETQPESEIEEGGE